MVVSLVRAVDLLVLATRNEGKAVELSRLLSGAVSRVETLAAYPQVKLPPEHGGSYREIAVAKALAVYEAVGLPALGDDSGIEVDALDGKPGLHSARFAGEKATDEENNALLLERLARIPPERRTARFRCALALVRAVDDVIEVEGVCEGRILDAPRGTQGFGYDPLFLPDGETRTFAELSPSRKDSLSHRGRAAAVLSRVLRAG
ncbi:MAG TPA: RdgB/HAM1 family non-canonical purine NTP pyrophosphatase [Candidatus Eisenbacteria bacterium]|nr:RdgB/HAM1 family non-canonical purine NTP pyrophosphatase [Candidatus Eisenbacteria bacterium]